MGKNKNIIIGILTIVLITSLYFNFRFKNESDLKNVQPQGVSEVKISSDDLFQKKQKCASYRADIEKILENQYFKNENVISSYHLDEIWFSPSLNTCLYSSNEWNQYLKEKTIEPEYSIYDYLQSDMIFHSSPVPETVTRREALDSFNKRKEELKK